jgi:hypothetical protein
MLKRLALAGLLSLALASAQAQDTPITPGALTTLSSGNVANASAAVTIPAVQGYLNRLCVVQITSAGATAASVVSPTITGLKGGTMTMTLAVSAGATITNQPLLLQFVPCAPASAVNTAIVVTVPALGAGNTNSTVSAEGYAGEYP